MSLKPLHDWAVIRPTEAREISSGGLYIPDTAKDKPREGVVEDIGPGAYIEEKGKGKAGEKRERRFVPTIINKGDVVIYEQYAGRTCKIDDEERVLVRERDILGTLPDGLAVRPKPLQIPSATSGTAATALMKRGPHAIEPVPAVKKVPKKAAKKTAVRTAGKSGKKAAKKAAKKSGKSAATGKKAATKKKSVAKKKTGARKRPAARVAKPSAGRAKKTAKKTKKRK